MKRCLYILLISFMVFPSVIKAQSYFDSDGGCLNVVDASFGKGIGEYGANVVSSYYLHERFVSERLCFGVGVGYNYHNRYKFSSMPICLSAHYFFFDSKVSPFVNIKAGGFAMFGKNNVNTNEKFSLSKEQPEFNLFLSPSVGVKVHLTSNMGLLASINDEAFLVKAFDVKKSDYANKLVNSIGFGIGVFFQIKGW